MSVKAIAKAFDLPIEKGEIDYKAFQDCTNLKNIKLTGSVGKSISFGHSQYLTDESIQNIIDVLMDRTGQTASVLTLHNNVKAKLTEEQIATITSKNWTLA